MATSLFGAFGGYPSEDYMEEARRRQMALMNVYQGYDQLAQKVAGTPVNEPEQDKTLLLLTEI